MKTNGLVIKRIAEHGLEMVKGRKLVHEKSKHFKGVTTIRQEAPPAVTGRPKIKSELLMSVPSHWNDDDIRACIYLSHIAYKEGERRGREDLRFKFISLLGLED